MRRLLIAIASKCNPAVLRLCVLALVATQLMIHSATEVQPIHNALVDAAETLGKPLDAMLPNVAHRDFTNSEFIYKRCERRNATYANGEPIGFDFLQQQIQFWPPHGIPIGPSSSHQQWVPIVAVVFTMALMLVPALDPAGKRRAPTAMVATLLITTPLPILASFLPKFWYTLTTGIPKTPIARFGIEPPGAWLTWSGVLAIYAIVYLKLRALTAPMQPTKNLCNACGYDLATLNTCPECNTPRGITPRRVHIRRHVKRLAPYALPPMLMSAPLWLTWTQAIR